MKLVCVSSGCMFPSECGKWEANIELCKYHSYNTMACSHGNLIPPKVKTESGKRKYMSRGVDLFNELPSLIKYPLASTHATFKCLYSVKD